MEQNMIVLDTSFLINYFRGRNPVDISIKDQQVAVTAVSHGASQIITDDRDFIEIAKVTDLEMTVFD
jgi:predicted nucleic acid-binding protein